MPKTYGRSTQSRLRAVQDSRGDLTPETEPGHRNPDTLPDGYGDPLLWQMAEEFERRAYREHVPLRRSVPYLYKGLARAVDRAGLRALAVRDARDRPVAGPALGVALVRFFWDEAPWDPAGDLLSQFTDSVMFADCLKALRKGWSEQRSHRILAEQKARGEYVPETFTRVRRPALKGGAWR